MRRCHPPSCLRRGLDCLIQADWTPEQALAVIELLDDLRERIWAHYQLAIVSLMREERRADENFHDIHAPSVLIDGYHVATPEKNWGPKAPNSFPLLLILAARIRRI